MHSIGISTARTERHFVEHRHLNWYSRNDEESGSEFRILAAKKTPSCVSYHIVRPGCLILFLRTWEIPMAAIRNLSPALLLAALFALQSTSSNAQPIGKATSVKTSG